MEETNRNIFIQEQGDMTFTSSVRIGNYAPFWRRLWFVVSCLPRYLTSGSVEVP